MADLTLPGTIPGLLRRGSPVVVTDERIGLARTPGVVTVPPDGDFPHQAVVAMQDEDAEIIGINSGCVSLDLSDATGRAHAAWWLASKIETSHSKRLGEEMHRVDLDPCTVRVICMEHRHGGGAARLDGFCRNCLPGSLWRYAGDTCGEYTFVHSEAMLPWDGERYRGQEELGHLNPLDDTRLPDGSRRVDAEALRIVCLHVAGVE